MRHHGERLELGGGCPRGRRVNRLTRLAKFIVAPTPHFVVEGLRAGVKSTAGDRFPALVFRPRNFDDLAGKTALYFWVGPQLSAPIGTPTPQAFLVHRAGVFPTRRDRRHAIEMVHFLRQVGIFNFEGSGEAQLAFSVVTPAPDGLVVSQKTRVGAAGDDGYRD